MNITAEKLKADNNGKLVSFEGPVCPYCNQRSILRPESYIYRSDYSGKNYWVCRNYPNCHSYVGTHGHGEWMNYPLGRLANKELRTLKTQAHELFDVFWKSKTLTRGHMYRWFQDIMGLTEPQAHIGELDIKQCGDLIHHLNQLFDTVQIKKETV